MPKKDVFGFGSIIDIKPTKVNRDTEDAKEIFEQMRVYTGAYEWMRKEYTDLRSLLNKRISRAKASGYMENYGYFPKLKDIPHKQAFSLYLAQARNLYENPLSTASGRKAREAGAIEALQERGFTGINKKNYPLFKKFMKLMSDKYAISTPDGKKKLYDSDKAVEAFEEISERFTSKTNTSAMMRYFNEWQEMGGSIL